MIEEAILWVISLVVLITSRVITIKLFFGDDDE